MKLLKTLQQGLQGEAFPLNIMCLIPALEWDESLLHSQLQEPRKQFKGRNEYSCGQKSGNITFICYTDILVKFTIT